MCKAIAKIVMHVFTVLCSLYCVQCIVFTVLCVHSITTHNTVVNELFVVNYNSNFGNKSERCYDVK